MSIETLRSSRFEPEALGPAGQDEEEEEEEGDEGGDWGDEEEDWGDEEEDWEEVWEVDGEEEAGKHRRPRPDDW